MNLNKLGGLDRLTEKERHWLGVLNRIAETRGWTSKNDVPDTRGVLLRLKDEVTLKNQIESYFYDSLMVGLWNQDPILVLRHYGLAKYYEGNLTSWDMPFPADALTTLQEKVERMMRRDP